MPKSKNKFIHVSKGGSFLFGIGLFVFILTFFNSSSVAQWRKIHTLGIVSTAGITNYFRTIDGGITWTQLPMDSEVYQPVAMKNIFYALSETNHQLTNARGYGLLCESLDGGLNWQPIYSFPFGVSGTIITNGSRLYIQSLDSEVYLNGPIPPLGKGVYYSDDAGFTWTLLGGPRTFYDTRGLFAGKCGVWAGDRLGGLWTNRTGIGSNSIPNLSRNQVSFNSLRCPSQFDSVITFTFFDSVNGNQALLIGVSIQGSQNFSIGSSSVIPRMIHENDSIIVSYNPQQPISDTAELHLSFSLGCATFDTSILLLGKGRFPKENVQFIPTLSPTSASSGSQVDLFVKPDKIISGRGLQTIAFDLNYFGDVLDYHAVTTNIPNATITIGAPTHSGKIETLPVTITGNDLMLDPAQSVADIKFTAMLSHTNATVIIISNMQLNNGDANYVNCVLSADTGNTNFTVNFVCGDTTLYEFLRTGKILSITSIHPNPVQDEVEIEIHSAYKQNANIELFNALGTKVFSDTKNFFAGINEIRVDTKNLSNGVYVVRIGDVSQTFVKIQ